MAKNDILLIGFYNEKALGVRYLAKALRHAGFVPHILFFKSFDSKRPKSATKKELRLLIDLIKSIQPFCIGLSVMSSFYLETIQLVAATIAKHFFLPTIWGGVFATLEPRRAAAWCDFVIRGEGEEAICELAAAIRQNRDFRRICNLAYYTPDGTYIENELRPLMCDIDAYGYPDIGAAQMYRIEHGRLTVGDPQLSSYSYELTASRGCPFSCTYCSAPNLRRLYRGKGVYLRFRSVASVIAELKEAKQRMPRLRFIHFWDEIFSDSEEFVASFCEAYKREIGLPFRIWGHPLKINSSAMQQLKDAGLYQISVGIQSGSPVLRRDIFGRYETQQQILSASQILSKCRIHQVYYDLMLDHPFEKLSDLRETFFLCLKLAPPFRLNIHGLNFLPATDITKMAIEQKIFTADELEASMYTTMQKQYDKYWGPAARSQLSDEKRAWLDLIYLTQFPDLHIRLQILAQSISQRQTQKQIAQLRRKKVYLAWLTAYREKARLFFAHSLPEQTPDTSPKQTDIQQKAERKQPL